MLKGFCFGEGGAALLSDRLTRKYLTGLDLAEGFLFLSDSPVYFTDARYYSAAAEKIAAAGITPALYRGKESIAAVIKERKINALYLDYSKTTVREYSEYGSLGVEIKDCSEMLEKRRAVKNDKESAYIEKACEIAQKAYYSAAKELKAGVTEIEIAKKIEEYIILYGGEGTSFETIVAFGANSAVPHHQTGETPLVKNSAVLVDMGAVYKGYCSDLTRTAFFGEPTEDFISAYQAVLGANIAAEEIIAAGMKTNEADAIARNYLAERGFGEYFTHSLGHGVGMEIHEFPALSPKSDKTLENGMFFTVEPGVYRDGEFGIRIEDTVMLKDGKIRRLFTDGKELSVLK